MDLGTLLPEDVRMSEDSVRPQEQWHKLSFWTSLEGRHLCPPSTPLGQSEPQRALATSRPPGRGACCSAPVRPSKEQESAGTEGNLRRGWKGVAQEERPRNRVRGAGALAGPVLAPRASLTQLPPFALPAATACRPPLHWGGRERGDLSGRGHGGGLTAGRGRFSHPRFWMNPRGKSIPEVSWSR